MPKESFIYGEGSAQDAIKVLYREMRDLGDYEASVGLATLAAAVKFGSTPRKLLKNMLRQAPADTIFETVRAPIEVAAQDEDDLASFDGPLH